MRIYRHYDTLPREARDAVIAIGNFDGVHLGHQAVIDEAGRLVGELEPREIMEEMGRVEELVDGFEREKFL